MSERGKILRLIMKNQQILFGNRNKKLKLEAKNKKWKEIAEHAHALEILDISKDWKHLRDIMWQNWRKRSVEKFENRKKNSAGQIKKYRLDSNDKIILQILGLIPRETLDQKMTKRKITFNPKEAITELQNKILEVKMKILERDCFLQDLELLEKQCNKIQH